MSMEIPSRCVVGVVNRVELVKHVRPMNLGNFVDACHVSGGRTELWDVWRFAIQSGASS